MMQELNGKVVFVDIANGRHDFRKQDYVIARRLPVTQEGIDKVTTTATNTTATRKQIQNEKLRY